MEALEFWAITLDFIGNSMIAFTAIMVHHRFLSEHKVDRKVFSLMKREQKIGIIGLIFLSVSYLLRLIIFFG